MDIKLALLLLIIGAIIGLSDHHSGEKWGPRLKPVRIKEKSGTRP
jgi:hypothetical protein